MNRETSIELPHHLIAPPTYNQTMGLVDEYEQRQLAFIEHVRSMLAQQQQQSSGALSLNGPTNPQLATLAIVPTVTSTSTIVHRVSNRRSHSSRNHRHHHHRASVTDTAQEPVRSHHRSHRHHRSHHSSSSRNHVSTNALSQVHFDANRRGLVLQTQNETSTAQSVQALQSEATIPESSMNTPVEGGSQANKLGSTSLRDRIARLIKDIVVHHGDNIQYVQLSEQNRSTISSNAGNSNSAEAVSSSSSNPTSAGPASEDDLPLIQP